MLKILFKCKQKDGLRRQNLADVLLATKQYDIKSNQIKTSCVEESFHVIKREQLYLILSSNKFKFIKISDDPEKASFVGYLIK